MAELDSNKKLVCISQLNKLAQAINSRHKNDFNMLYDYIDGEHNDLNTTNKTMIGAINELELEVFEAKANIIALDMYKADKVKENLVNKTIVENKIILTTDKRQKVEMVDGTEIVLPTVSDYTEIHLYFSTLTDLTLIFPTGKYQKTPEIKANKTYEFIFTYIGEWLISYIEYGN